MTSTATSRFSLVEGRGRPRSSTWTAGMAKRLSTLSLPLTRKSSTQTFALPTGTTTLHANQLTPISPTLITHFAHQIPSFDAQVAAVEADIFVLETKLRCASGMDAPGLRGQIQFARQQWDIAKLIAATVRAVGGADAGGEYVGEGKVDWEMLGMDSGGRRKPLELPVGVAGLNVVVRDRARDGLVTVRWELVLQQDVGVRTTHLVRDCDTIFNLG
ncbi:uncharacterized protein EV422DRAFT_541807 [Fimicolochytrium jonesii]|uniref:uncharacterized protein n=1 Tax=Fimicolochytrium jonesii TaxID=1396493 RepID=UPI0022FECD4F|nr:uncharacterized protein EV422DRAFT_541807 [Fimicolochytrium jonesii]KAI8817441.1 hypothetical protein EV422DRAFT_541807 [Fimicolochytrium jonesii]